MASVLCKMVMAKRPVRGAVFVVLTVAGDAVGCVVDGEAVEALETAGGATLVTGAAIAVITGIAASKLLSATDAVLGVSAAG